MNEADCDKSNCKNADERVCLCWRYVKILIQSLNVHIDKGFMLSVLDMLSTIKQSEPEVSRPKQSFLFFVELGQISISQYRGTTRYRHQSIEVSTDNRVVHF